VIICLITPSNVENAVVCVDSTDVSHEDERCGVSAHRERWTAKQCCRVRGCLQFPTSWKFHDGIGKEATNLLPFGNPHCWQRGSHPC
jgi:hypothetical protein